MIADGAGIFSN